MTLESLNTFFQFASAILLGLTFIVGAGAIITNHLLNKRNAIIVASMQRDVAHANEVAATANEGTAEAIAEAAVANERTKRMEVEAASQRIRAAQAELQLAEVVRKQGPRWFNGPAFTAALKGKAKGTISIFVVPPDTTGEASTLAAQFWAGFGNAGWKTPVPPIQTASELDRQAVMFSYPFPDLPATLKVGVRRPEGILLVTASIEHPSDTYLAAKDAMLGSGLGVSLAADATLAPDVIRLVIGPKQ